MVEEQLAGAVKGIRQMVMVKQLKEMAESGPAPAAAGGVPAAQSVSELMKAAVDSSTAVAAQHKGFAEVAMAQAKEARLEAREAKELSDGAYAAGVQETEAKSDKIFTMQEQSHQKTMAMFDKVTDMRVSQVEKQASDAIARITETAQAALAAKDQQIATLKEQLQSVAGRRTLQEEVVEHILGRESPLLKSLIGMSQPNGTDPQTEFHKALAPIMARITGEKMEEELHSARDARKTSAAIKNAASEAIGALGDLLRQPDKIADVVRAAMGGAAAPTAPPPGFVPNTFDAAPEPAPAQPAAAAFAGITLDEGFGSGGVF